jgi:hypothetical protein
MRIYRHHWLVCFAIVSCLIAWATPHAAGSGIQSSRTEIAWDPNPDLAVLTSTAPVVVTRSSPRPQPNLSKGQPPTLRDAEVICLPVGAFTFLIQRSTRLERDSSHLEQTNDQPRAPPRTRSA